VPSDLNQNSGEKSLSFYTDSGNQIFLRGNVKNEDTDMIRLFTSMDTLVQLTKRLPTAMDIQDSEAQPQQQEDPVVFYIISGIHQSELLCKEYYTYIIDTD
jgi:hypothetical protein